MPYYLFKEYICGTEALFATRHEAEVFASKYVYYMGQDIEDSDYTIVELELNPNFNKWINEIEG